MKLRLAIRVFTISTGFQLGLFSYVIFWTTMVAFYHSLILGLSSMSRLTLLSTEGVARLVKAAYRDLLTIDNNIPFPFVTFNFHALLSDKKGSRRLYNSFALAKTVTRKFVDKWERQLELHFELDVWSRIFIVPFTCTVDSKLRWFQFKFIHRVLGTNLFLCKIPKVGV